MAAGAARAVVERRAIARARKHCILMFGGFLLGFVGSSR